MREFGDRSTKEDGAGFKMKISGCGSRLGEHVINELELRSGAW